MTKKEMKELMNLPFTICWLILSQRTTNVRNAVKLYRDMQLEEEIIREEGLKG